MELGIKERLLFEALYPKESDLMTQIIVRGIREKIKISDDELKEIEFKAIPSPNGRYFNWNKEKEKVVTIEFTEPELQLLKDQVINLDENKKINSETLDICLKIKEEKNKK